MKQTETKRDFFGRLRESIKDVELSSSYIALIVISGFIGACLGTYMIYRTDNKSMSASEALAAVLESRNLTYIIVVSTVIPIAYFMLRYLDRGSLHSDTKEVSPMESINAEFIIKKHIYVNDEIEKLVDDTFVRIKQENPEKEYRHLKEEILGEVYSYVRRTTRSELNDMLTEEFSASKKKKIEDLLIEKELDKSCKRIENEIRNLLRRGNLNLVIGILTSVAPLGFLIFSLQYQGDNINRFLFQYMPKISITIFVEIFSFFFLRLYRNSLADIKYYQNELTNIEFKLISIRLSTKEDNKELLASVINKLLETERNFVIKADENIVTTALIEKENSRDKSYVENVKTVIDSLSNLMNKK